MLLLTDTHAALDHLYLDGTQPQLTAPADDYLRASASPYTLAALIAGLDEVITRVVVTTPMFPGQSGRRGSGGFGLHETERVSGRVGVDPVGFVIEHDTFPERDRAQGAHPLIGDLEVVDPHIQVKLLRWPLVRPAGRAVIGDLLEHQAPSAVGGVRDVDPAGVLLHPLPAEDGRPEPGGECRRPGSPRRCSSAGPTGVSIAGP